MQTVKYYNIMITNKQRNKHTHRTYIKNDSLWR